MSTLKITDGMFLSLRKQCADDFVESVMKGVEIVISNTNNWDISDYFETEFSGARNIDKANFVICFLEKGGIVSYGESQITKESIPNFLSYLFTHNYITNEEEADISLKWTDFTYGEPYLTL